MQTLFSATVLFLLAVFGHADVNYECDTGNFEEGKTVGQPMMTADHYSVKCMTRWKDGATIVGMRGWSTEDEITGVQFKFSDDRESEVLGYTIPDKSVFFQKKEGYKMAGGDYAIWGAKGENEGIRIKLFHHSRKATWQTFRDQPSLARILIWRASQKPEEKPFYELGINNKNVDNNNPVEPYEGKGTVMAVKGRANPQTETNPAGHVLSLEFKFLRSSVASSDVSEIHLLDDLNKWNTGGPGGGPKGINPNAAMGNFWWRNTNAINGSKQLYHYLVGFEVETSYTISRMTSNTWGAGITVGFKLAAEIPGIVKEETSIETHFRYERQQVHMDSETEGFKTQLQLDGGSGFNDVGLLAPQMAANCKLYAVSGQYSSRFEGKLFTRYMDGSNSTTRIQGTMDSITWAESDIVCRDMPLSEAPPKAMFLGTFDSSDNNTQQGVSPTATMQTITPSFSPLPKTPTAKRSVQIDVIPRNREAPRPPPRRLTLSQKRAWNSTGT